MKFFFTFRCYLFFLLLFNAVIVNAQNKSLCFFEDPAEFGLMEYTYNGVEKDAKKLFNSILEASNCITDRNIELRKKKNLRNAASKIDTQSLNKVIEYNPYYVGEFLKRDEGTWGVIGVLAHEIGHHLLGHLTPKDKSQALTQEAEADIYVGYVLRKMGASLEQAQKCIKLNDEVLWDAEPNTKGENEDYPATGLRMREIENGFNYAENPESTCPHERRIFVLDAFIKENKKGVPIFTEKYGLEIHFDWKSENLSGRSIQTQIILLQNRLPIKESNNKKEEVKVFYKNRTVPTQIKGRNVSESHFIPYKEIACDNNCPHNIQVVINFLDEGENLLKSKVMYYSFRH
jgi:hypothetical protein